MTTPLEMLEAVALALESMLDELVFVGGAVLPFYVARTAAAEIRVTDDVDCVIPAATLKEFHSFEARLRALGCRPCQEKGAPLCRYVVASQKVDFMPFDDAALGFTNRWYRPGMDASIRRRLDNGLHLRLLARPYFIAVKLEAHKGRGSNDVRMSQDLEDALRVLDVPEAFLELSGAAPDLRGYLASEFAALLEDPLFEEAVESALGPGAGARHRLLASLKAWCGN